MITAETKGPSSWYFCKLIAKCTKHFFRPDGDQGNVRAVFVSAKIQIEDLHHMDQC